MGIGGSKSEDVLHREWLGRRRAEQEDLRQAALGDSDAVADGKTWSSPAQRAGVASLLKRFPADLRNSVVFTPEDEDGTKYHELRCDAWNKDAVGMPAAICVPRSIEELQALVKTCSEVLQEANDGKEEGDFALDIAVAGGRHSHACRNDGSVVLDLREFNQVEIVDSDGNDEEVLVDVGGGSVLADVDKALAGVKRAVPTGTNGTTGVGGLTLAGGWGWLARRHGFSVDHLVEVDVVTASGEFVTASDLDGKNQDLLWGLRGGGSNFGIVTRFRFTTVPVPKDPLVGEVVYMAPTVGSATAVVKNYAAWLDSQSGGGKEASTSAAALTGPSVGVDAVGHALVLPLGAPVVPSIWAAYGTDDHKIETVDDVEGLRAVTEFGGWFKVANKWEQMSHHTGLQKKLEEKQQPALAYDTAFSLSALNRDDVIESIVHFCRVDRPNAKGVSGAMLVAGLGGRIASADPSNEKTSCPHRGAVAWLLVNATWPYEDELSGGHAKAEIVAWVGRMKKRFNDELGVVVTTAHANPDGEALGVEDDALRLRLRKLKSTYDPHNMFHLNKNILPSEE